MEKIKGGSREEENIGDLSDEDSDEKHNKLIEAISKLDKKSTSKKYQTEQRCEPSTEVSEFHLAQGGKEHVRINDLLMPLKKSKRYDGLKKQLKAVTRTNITLPAPLPKPQAERIQRGIAYNKVSSELNKWDGVVQTNRTAEQLVFPLKQADLKLRRIEDVVKQFKPKTPLEIEVAKLLQQSDNGLTEDKTLTRAEEAALKAMSIEEAQECRRQLQRLRALTSYQEAKARRQNKIKSKSYHRILKRERLRKAVKEFEELKKTNPELAAEKLKDLDKQRIQERMTLKHKSTGKWAKQQKLRAKYDDAAREALAHQLDLNKQLTKKVVAASGSDEEESTNDKDEVDRDVQEKFFASLNYNPWLKSSLHEKLDNAKTVAPQNDKSHAISLESEETPVEKDNAESAKDKEGDEIEPRNEVVQNVTTSKPTKDNVINCIKPGTGTAKGKQKKKAKKRKMKGLDKEKTVEKDRTIAIPDDNEEEGEEEEQEAELIQSLTRKQTIEDFDDAGEELPEQQTNEEPKEPPRELKERKDDGEKRPKMQEESQKIEVDPTKFVTLKSRALKSAVPSIVTPGEEALDEADKQRMLIAEAFAEENIVDEFRAEKEAIIESENPKEVELSLPGWGDWTGPGVQPPKRKKLRMFHKKTQPQQPRRDHKLGHVIFSGKKNEKLAKHMVKEVPFPFKSVQQYESSIRQPISTTWNPESVFKKLTVPPVVTKLGKIIEPIDSDALLLKKKPNRNKSDFDTSAPIKITF